MLRRLTRLRKVLVCWCAAVFVWGWVPLFTDGKMSVGVLIPVLIAPAVAAWLVATPPLSQAKGRIKGMLIASVVVACVAAVLAGVVCGLMAHAAAASPRDGATVIVLGSKIHGDQPSRMLRQRLDEAADRLSEDPTAHCVVSGGLGEGETYTEAYVMKKYLVEQRGIDADRIACENASTDTYENLHLSMDVIRAHGWSTDVVIATQVFHQYRARRLAFDAGATAVGGVACFSPVHLMFCYWVRECGAIARLWVMGY